jgi:hypothetical protein
VAAATLKDRDRPARRHLDHGAELVEHQRPQRAGLRGRVVEVGEREYGHRGGLVGHDVGVHPPHHDGSRSERVDEADADRLAVGGESRGNDLTVGERERHLESSRPA